MAENDDPALVDTFPSRAIDHDSSAFYAGWRRRELLVGRCAACGHWRHPPRPVCPRCWSTDVRPTPVTGGGTIFMVVLLHQGPRVEGVDYAAPHPVVTVELDEQAGLRLTSTVVGAHPADITVGRRVELTWIDRGGAPMPAFTLVAEQSS